MKKLQFIASCPQHGVLDHPQMNAISLKNMQRLYCLNNWGNYGFDAQHIVHEHEKGGVSIDNHLLPLSITCQQTDHDGHLMCEISCQS